MVAISGQVERTLAPEAVRDAEGRLVYESATRDTFACASHIAGEVALMDRVKIRDRWRVDGAAADEALKLYAEAAGLELGDDQAEAVRRVLTSGARWTGVNAGAGTGKSVAMAASAEIVLTLPGGGRVIAWTDEDRALGGSPSIMRPEGRAWRLRAGTGESRRTQPRIGSRSRRPSMSTRTTSMSA